MIKWGAVIAAIVFLIVAADALGQKYAAEANYGKALIAREQGIAAANLKAQQTMMLIAAFPYFATFAIFLFVGLICVLVFQYASRPTITNNYILEMKHENDPDYISFVRNSGRVISAHVPGRRGLPESTGKHQRSLHD